MITRPERTGTPDSSTHLDVSLASARHRSVELEAQLAVNPRSFSVLSGDRPTGPLHLGHYIGTLRNRVRLQNLGVPVTLVIADYQVLTDRADAGPLRERVRELTADYLAVGIDPERSVVFPHSAVPALNQLLLPFLSLVTVAELQRNPTVKAELQATDGRPLSALLLTYPVHQAADILFCGATLVPVGKDQLPHLEQARVIARRFNQRYGRTFDEPEALLSEAPSVLGTDGRKMSKSRGNTVPLGATADDTAKILRSARTDSQTAITYDPVGRPQVSNLLTVAAALTGRSPADVADEIGSGAGRLKQCVIDLVNAELAPLRQRRSELLADPGYLDAVLLMGTALARAVADETLNRVHAAMGMDYLA